jgi:hypothetical protein
MSVSFKTREKLLSTVATAEHVRDCRKNTERSTILLYQLVVFFISYFIGNYMPLQALAETRSESDSSDWIFLEQESIDVFLGAFHDRVSGAFVNLEVGFPEILSPAAQEIAKRKGGHLVTGENEGWPYAMVLMPEDRTKFINSICPVTPQPIRGQALVISFKGDDPHSSTWNFTTLICGPSQLERVKDFLINGQQWRKPSGQNLEPRTLTPGDLKMASPGTTWSHVRELFGSSFDPFAFKGGFAVSYYYGSSKEIERNQRTWFIFDQARTLKEVAYKTPNLPLYPGPR